MEVSSHEFQSFSILDENSNSGRRRMMGREAIVKRKSPAAEGIGLRQVHRLESMRFL